MLWMIHCTKVPQLQTVNSEKGSLTLRITDAAAVQLVDVVSEVLPAPNRCATLNEVKKNTVNFSEIADIIISLMVLTVSASPFESSYHLLRKLVTETRNEAKLMIHRFMLLKSTYYER